jgi:hypothetical protein
MNYLTRDKPPNQDIARQHLLKLRRRREGL